MRRPRPAHESRRRKCIAVALIRVGDVLAVHHALRRRPVGCHAAALHPREVARHALRHHRAPQRLGAQYTLEVCVSECATIPSERTRAVTPTRAPTTRGCVHACMRACVTAQG
eukprot:6904175-Prymnesium_polylepis.1